MSSRSDRAARGGALALLCLLVLLLAACFRPPVVEEIRLRFAATGETTAAVVTRLEVAPEEKTAAGRAVSAYRERIERGDDPWRPSIALAAPERETSTVDRLKGEVFRVERQLSGLEPGRIEGLFSGDAVRAGVSVEGREVTLSLLPIGSRAEGGDQKRLEMARTAFLAAASRYLEVTARLWRFVNDHPEWRRAAVALAFEPMLAEEEKEAAGKPEADSDAGRLFAEYDQEADDFSEFLLGEHPKGSDLPLEHVSRRAHHPLRARLRVEVVGEVVEVLGFERAGEGNTYAVPELSLLSALDRVALEVVSPFPLGEVVAWMSGTGAEDPPPVALATLAGRDLRGGGVPADLGARIDAALRPPGEYRLRWRLPGEPGAARE
jgi:hypothetical protein